MNTKWKRSAIYLVIGLVLSAPFIWWRLVPHTQQLDKITRQKAPLAIAVTVVSSADQHPLPGAKVLVEIDNVPVSLITDATGFVTIRLPNTPPQKLAINTQAAGYVPQQRSFPPAIAIPDHLKFTLGTGATVGGFVTDEKQMPLTGVQVNVTVGPVAHRDQRFEFTKYTVHTDSSGRWSSSEFPPGATQLNLVLSHPDCTEQIDLSAAEPEEVAAIFAGTLHSELHRRVAIEGTITTPDEAPAAGAWITAVPEPKPQPDPRIKNPWANLPEPQYVATLSLPVSADSVTCSGELKNPTKKSPLKPVETDRKGHYRLLVNYYPFRLIVLHPAGWQMALCDDVAASGDLKLRGFGNITGTLLVDASPKPNAKIELHETKGEFAADDARGGIHCRMTTTTDDHGRFTFSGVPKGDVELDYADTAGRTFPQISTTVRVLTGKTVDVAVKFPSRDVNGRVILAPGTSMPDGVVFIPAQHFAKITKIEQVGGSEKRYLDDTPRNMSPLQYNRSAVVQADGRFRIIDLPHGEYRVEGVVTDAKGMPVGVVSREINLEVSDQSVSQEPFAMGDLSPEMLGAIHPGDAAPPFAVTSMAGRELTEKTARGKVAIITFARNDVRGLSPISDVVETELLALSRKNPGILNQVIMLTFEQGDDPQYINGLGHRPPGSEWIHIPDTQEEPIHRAYGSTGTPLFVALKPDGTIGAVGHTQQDFRAALPELFPAVEKTK